MPTLPNFLLGSTPSPDPLLLLEACDLASLWRQRGYEIRLETRPDNVTELQIKVSQSSRRSLHLVFQGDICRQMLAYDPLLMDKAYQTVCRDIRLYISLFLEFIQEEEAVPALDTQDAVAETLASLRDIQIPHTPPVYRASQNDFVLLNKLQHLFHTQGIQPLFSYPLKLEGQVYEGVGLFHNDYPKEFLFFQTRTGKHGIHFWSYSSKNQKFEHTLLKIYAEIGPLLEELLSSVFKRPSSVPADPSVELGFQIQKFLIPFMDEGYCIDPAPQDFTYEIHHFAYPKMKWTIQIQKPEDHLHLLVVACIGGCSFQKEQEIADPKVLKTQLRQALSSPYEFFK